MIKAANISSIPQRSPFRYPGGKTWLIPQVRSWLRACGGKDIRLIEPFAGGGIVSLTAVMEGLVGATTMIELDPDVAFVWRAILGRCGRTLAEKIYNFPFNRENVIKVLESKPRNLKDRAFQTILKNRVKRNGILAPGAGMLKKGESGYGIKSRWYPETLAGRILEITKYRKKITFRHDDGLQYIKNCIGQSNFIYFIDPPYCNIGKRLYKYGEINHEELFEIMAQLKGNFLMTYSKTEEILEFAKKYGFRTEEIKMNGGLNNSKVELLIGRRLNWLFADNSSKIVNQIIQGKFRMISDLSLNKFDINSFKRSSRVF